MEVFTFSEIENAFTRDQGRGDRGEKNRDLSSVCNLVIIINCSESNKQQTKSNTTDNNA